MKFKLVFFVVLFFLRNIDAQTSKTEFSGFKLSLSKGVTYNFDKIRVKAKPLSAGEYRYNIELTEIELGYFITKNHEAGLSVGKNLFSASEEDFIITYSVDVNNDTTFYYSDGHKYISQTWFALYYNFMFAQEYKVGIKLGGLRPTFVNDDFPGYLSLTIGKYYRITENFLADIRLSYSNKFREFKYFQSNQISFSLGLNLDL